MLMALLPLAGWAAEPDNINGGVVTLSSASSEYDGTVKAAPTAVKIEVTGSDDLTTIAKMNITSWKNAEGETVTELKNAGVYTCTVQYEGIPGSATGTFTITKKPVTLTVDDKEITFGAALPTFTLTYAGLVDADKAAPAPAPEAPKDGVFVGEITYTAQLTGVDYVAGDPVKGKVGAYTVVPNFSAVTSTNYDFTPVNGTLTVNAKDLASSMLGEIAAQTYNGADYKPTPVLTDAVLTTDKHALAAGDYTVTYHTTEANADADVAAAVDALKNAGTYWIKIKGANNYKGSFKAEYTVSKKNLAISTNNQTVEYGTAPTLTLAARATFDGLIAADADTGLPKAATYKLGAALSVEAWQAGVKVANPEKAIGEYDVVVVSTAADDETFVNYTPIYFNGGKLTVNKKELLFTIKNQSKKEGTIHALDAEAGVTPIAANQASYFTAISALGVAGDGISVYPTLKKGDAIANGYKIVADLSAVKVKNGDDDVTANYDIKATTTATYTIEAGQINVKPVNVTINYGDAAQAIDISLVGVAAEDEAAAKAAILKAFAINKAGVPVNDAGVAIAGDATYPNAGIYSIAYDEDKLDLGDLAGKYSVLAFDGTYTIKKRELKKISPLAQTLPQGISYSDAQDAINLLGVNETLTFDMKDGDTYKLTDTDKRIMYVEILAAGGFTVENAAYLGTVGIHKNKIGISALANALTNFKALATGTADVTIVAAAGAPVKLDRDLADDNAGAPLKVVTTNSGKMANVEFGTRVLAAQKWNSFVLPFETSAAELSEEFGYAVFNIIDEANSTDDNVRFKLHMGIIPANTPFLMKTYEEIDMASVTIPQVVISKTGINAETGLAEQAIGTTANKFIGNYKKVAMKANNSFPVNDDWKKGKASGVNLKALAAYLEYPEGAAAPMITLQEADGSTTAIEAINADGVAVEKTGWYTTNGIKLEGAPTEKGIYIRNGKKMVIK